MNAGVLVDAMRHGHWIILDELNLAPTEVLEALNRVGVNFTPVCSLSDSIFTSSILHSQFGVFSYRFLMITENSLSQRLRSWLKLTQTSCSLELRILLAYMQGERWSVC